MQEHKCKKCGLTKPISEFNKSKATASGHDYRCKTCRREYKLEKRSDITVSYKLYIQKIASEVPFHTYRRMLDRCLNPTSISYKSYGARGIRVCEEWLKDKNAFYNWALENGWTQGLTIDRIDTDGNYEPSNCRWVTRSENIAKKNRERRK